MRHYASSATIDAPPDAVWTVLVDGARYPDWESGVVRVEGTIAPGASLKVVSSANPGRAFPVTVTVFEPSRRMVWAGGMPLGLFRGVRTFTLTPEAGLTTLSVREEYSGPLLSLIWRSMPDLQPSFDQFTRGIKQRVEHSAAL
ncbi:MAG: SRPBCC family protein [Kineosporiaceae bacterium]